MHNRLSVFAVLLLAVSLTACEWQKTDDNDDLVVSVYDKGLTKQQLRKIIPDGASYQDSIELSDKYTQEWVAKELLVEKAKLNIGDDQDIRDMVEEYRNSLLVSRYLELMVEQKANNEPTEDEVLDYYQLFKDNFLLKEVIVRGSFLKINLEAPRMDDVKKWIQSKSVKDSLLLDDYCFRNATNFEHFGEKWVSMDVLSNHLPEEINTRSSRFSAGNLIEQKDSLFLYLLKLDQVKLENDTAPLEFVSPKIYKILRHQKKLNYLSMLKKSIYDEAIKDKVIVFYDED